jgi:hypothetical protein
MLNENENAIMSKFKKKIDLNKALVYWRGIISST